MKRTLLTALAFWVLLLSPGLCLAGAIEHLCADCPDRTACSHEDDCDNDPCVDMVPPAAGKILFDSGSLPVWNHLIPVTDSTPANTATILWSSLPPVRDNLPRPESDLPLLA